MQRALEPAVRLESFPKAQVDIYASVHESGGSGRPPRR
uniref:Exosome complex component mtr3-like n=1 Tax=Tetraselmis sp. GSL018 TaxID=582737 RepID=A0A061S704_9CHLO